jgi:hypothetical protein
LHFYDFSTDFIRCSRNPSLTFTGDPRQKSDNYERTPILHKTPWKELQSCNVVLGRTEHRRWWKSRPVSTGLCRLGAREARGLTLDQLLPKVGPGAASLGVGDEAGLEFLPLRPTAGGGVAREAASGGAVLRMCKRLGGIERRQRKEDQRGRSRGGAVMEPRQRQGRAERRHCLLPRAHGTMWTRSQHWP